MRALVLFVLCSAFVLDLCNGVIVKFEECPGADRAPDCTVHQVRIDPCPEQTDDGTCKFKKRKGVNATVSFDFSPNFTSSADDVENSVWWASPDGDLPFTGIQKNACSYVTCPLKQGEQQTYSYGMEIQKKFPSGTFDVKWKISTAEEKFCCLMMKIKLQ